jgi:hypothetical protein
MAFSGHKTYQAIKAKYPEIIIENNSFIPSDISCVR